MRYLSTNTSSIVPSGIRTITNKVLTMPDALRLEIGEPDFPTPEHIVEAAHRAASDGFTRYTETQGLHSLREIWTERLAGVNGFQADPGQLVVTAGATAGLFAVFASVLDSGDEILMPDPGWPNWSMMTQLIGAKAVFYPCAADQGWQPDLKRIEELLTPRTRAVLVNSPANPTGAVLNQVAIEAFAEFARRNDLWLISDECYDGIVFDGDHLGAATADQDDRTITVVSCSKTYAMTGWRVGCVAAPSELAPSIAKVQQATQASVCAISQKAAEAALSGPQDCVIEMREVYRRRRDLVVQLLASKGRKIIPPPGAFYAMIDLSDTISDSTAFALNLLERHNVALAPGSAFGANSHGAVRLALCASDDTLNSGLSRLLVALEEMRAGA